MTKTFIKRISLICKTLIVVIALLHSTSSVVLAIDPCVGRDAWVESVTGDISITTNQIPTIDYLNNTMEISLNNVKSSVGSYQVILFVQNHNDSDGVVQSNTRTLTQGSSDIFTLTLDEDTLYEAFTEAEGSKRYESMDLKLMLNGSEVCQIADINLKKFSQEISCEGVEVVQKRPVIQNGTPLGKECRIMLPDGCLEVSKNINLIVRGIKTTDGTLASRELDYSLFKRNNPVALVKGTIESDDTGNAYLSDVALPEVGLYDLKFKYGELSVGGTCGHVIFSASPGCFPEECSELAPELPEYVSPGSLTFELCAQVGPGQTNTCAKCLDEEGGIWTAVGCIKTEPKAIIESVVQIGVGIGGGIALLMTLIGGFLLTTSQGDPKRTQEGKDMITSSVIGIIFILFSVVALQFIGVTILRLPGFGVV